MKHRADTLEPAITEADEGAPTVTGRHAHPAAEAPEDELTEARQLEAELVQAEAAGVVPPHMIPATATWKSRRLGRTLLSILAAAAMVAVVPTTAYYWQMRTDDRLRVLIAVTLLAIGLWSVLAARRPQRVRLDGSILTVTGRRTTDSFDLADGMQPVELSGDPRKARWALTLGRPDATDLVLTRRDVDAIAVDPIVRHFRDIAERRRAQRWAMLGL